MNRSNHLLRMMLACSLAVSSAFAAHAQAPMPAPAPGAPAPGAPAAAPPPASPALEQLGWLRGCWGGNVNRRDFMEQWLPPRADMMVGVSHTTVQNRKNPNEARTEDYTYLRLEARTDGVYYVAIPSGKKELPFKLTKVEDDKGDRMFTFAGASDGFPQRIVYRHTGTGMLFAEVDGKVDGKDKQVIYPMRHVDCATGGSPRG
jgi:hypothetical protein